MALLTPSGSCASIPHRLPAVRSCLPAQGQRVKAQRRGRGALTHSLTVGCTQSSGRRACFSKSRRTATPWSSTSPSSSGKSRAAPQWLHNFPSSAGVPHALQNRLPFSVSCLMTLLEQLEVLGFRCGVPAAPGMILDRVLHFFLWDRVWNLRATGVRRVCCCRLIGRASVRGVLHCLGSS